MRNWAAAIFILLLVPSARAADADRMAWNDFIRLVTPAAPRAVAFETWASDTDIYGATPHWPQNGAKQLRFSLAAVAEHMAAGAAPPTDCQPQDGKAGNFPPGACLGEEVMHNRPVYDTIVNNGLNTRSGLIKFYNDKSKQLDFPASSIVVKADWALVRDILRWQKQYKTGADVRRSFYTTVASMNGETGEYALLGMSVQSKTMKNWLWSTFEHRSNPGRCDEIGCHDSFGAVVADVAPIAAPTNSDYGPCAKTAALAALFAKNHLAPIWANYCLKGTQTRFVEPNGQPTILANSVIERMNKGAPVLHTSCITCHAYASFDATGTAYYQILRTFPHGLVTPPVPANYKLHDYVWGVLAVNH